MHRNPLVRGLVLEPGQWLWSSFRYYGYRESGPVLVDEPQRSEMRIRNIASGEFSFPTLRKPRSVGQPHFRSTLSARKGGPARLDLINEWCRVLDFHVGPLEAVPMHLNPDRIVIALTDANYRLTRPKYGTTLIDARAGEITWRPAELAAIESTSSHAIEQILIAPRPFALGPFAPKEPVKPPQKKR